MRVVRSRRASPCSEAARRSGKTLRQQRSTSGSSGRWPRRLAAPGRHRTRSVGSQAFHHICFGFAVLWMLRVRETSWLGSLSVPCGLCLAKRASERRVPHTQHALRYTSVSAVETGTIGQLQHESECCCCCCAASAVRRVSCRQTVRRKEKWAH